MLVQNPLKLEVRCSTRWTIAAVCGALALTLLAATFSSQPEVLATDEATGNRAATEPAGDFFRQQSEDPATAIGVLQDKSVKSGSPPKAAAAVENDSAVSPAV